MHQALADWERFLHERDGMLPPLVVASLLHYQFETIHPFLDGNGRLGRLIIVLYLLDTGELSEPLLNLSLWFERDRDAYYDHLQSVRERGAMQEWLRYFLDGVAHQANDPWLEPSSSLTCSRTTEQNSAATAAMRSTSSTCCSPTRRSPQHGSPESWASPGRAR